MANNKKFRRQKTIKGRFNELKYVEQFASPFYDNSGNKPERNETIVSSNDTQNMTTTNMTEQLKSKGKSRIQSIFTKLQMYKNSTVFLDDFVAEYEKYHNVQLGSDLHQYFGNKNVYFVLAKHLTDIVTVIYNYESERPRLMLQARHDFQLTATPQKRMTFSVIESTQVKKSPTESINRRHLRQSSYPHFRPLAPGQQYTTAGGDGVYTSDEDE